MKVVIEPVWWGGGSKIIDEVEQSEIWKGLGRQEILIQT